MQNHHCGVVLVGDYLYGYSDTLGFLCQDFKTGKEKWAERNRIDGKCAVSGADGYLYLLTEEGEAVLLRASPADWEEHGRFSLPPSRHRGKPGRRTRNERPALPARPGIHLLLQCPRRVREKGGIHLVLLRQVEQGCWIVHGNVWAIQRNWSSNNRCKARPIAGNVNQGSGVAFRLGPPASNSKKPNANITKQAWWWKPRQEPPSK